MRHVVRLSLLGLSLATVAAPAYAQYQGRGRGGSYSRDPSFDIPRPAPGVASLAVWYGGDLQLSQQQLDAIEAIRQHQDSANGPWLRVLDSLRNGPRPVNPLDLSQEQREQLAAQRATVKAATDAMRDVNADARTRVMALLTPDQQLKAGQLEQHAQELARTRSEDQRSYQSDGYGGRRRGRGGHMTLAPGA